MATAGEAFRAGDLAAAVAAAQAAVRAAPRDSGARWLLAELMLFAGDAERADKMLDAAVLEDPSPAVLEFRKLLRAEVIRQQVWNEGRAPKFSGDDATPAQQAAIRAAVLARANAPEDASAEALAAEEARPKLSGTAELADGTTLDFDDLRDADDLLAPMVEVLTTGGDHILVPLERVALLEFETPRRPRDLAWRRTTIELKDGTEGVVYMPTIYAAPTGQPDPLRLGRATEWTEGPGPVRGRGQRVFLIGEEAVALADLAALRFG
ncbi:type VI secretion system protein ImpE [Humitalea rosea]|uniref:Type VI secretion system protein ImpE n=1 Tax=Humitalea rosea TaxID=990373 RepID=A0A2W7IU76_9PROT|nr:type VI secretion system accessory protein TagJ [Humitalea rosea]PZW51009.1 type VI secretion system protein ImpE [Humitalea rosea]